MRTTIRLDDQLLAAAKRHASETGRTLTALIEDALREAIARERGGGRGKRIKLLTGGSGGLRPGVDLFFYRDQNGVEIDFFIERKGVLFMIESKANERIQDRELHFRRLVPLFSDRPVKTLVAQNIPHERLVKLKEYSVFNPLYTTLSLE